MTGLIIGKPSWGAFVALLKRQYYETLLNSGEAGGEYPLDDGTREIIRRDCSVIVNNARDFGAMVKEVEGGEDS